MTFNYRITRIRNLASLAVTTCSPCCVYGNTSVDVHQLVHCEKKTNSTSLFLQKLCQTAYYFDNLSIIHRITALYDVLHIKLCFIDTVK